MCGLLGGELDARELADAGSRGFPCGWYVPSWFLVGGTAGRTTEMGVLVAYSRGGILSCSWLGWLADGCQVVVALALGAVAVATRVIHGALDATVALIQLPAKGRCAAVDHVLHHPPVGLQHVLAKPLEVSGSSLAEDVRQLDHGGRWATRSLA